MENVINLKTIYKLNLLLSQSVSNEEEEEEKSQ